MNFRELSLYLNNEDEAEQYLIKSGILKHFDKCLICGSSHLGRVRRGKHKCYGCNTEWNLRKGSFIERRKISLGEFIGVLKFFSDGVSATRCAEELGVGIKPTGDIYADIRKALFVYKPFVLNDSHKAIFFIKEVQEQVVIELADAAIKNDDTSEFIAIRSRDANSSYSFNFNYKTKRSKNFLRNIEKIDRLDNFFRFCQERLLTYRGRDMNSLYYTLQELAFRYNHRREDFFNILINKLTY